MDYQELVDEAFKASQNAYVPYSHFRVGTLDQNPIFTYTNLRTQKSVNFYFKKCLDKDQKMCYHIIKKKEMENKQYG